MSIALAKTEGLPIVTATSCR